jgi:hypothetical protein
MPKDRKQTYSDRQSQASRDKKQTKQPKRKIAREDSAKPLPGSSENPLKIAK